MSKIFDIVRRDAETYYEYGTNSRLGRWKTLCAFAVFSLFIALIVGNASDNFLSGALAAQAILVGFSFNVLFYLVANRLTKPPTFSSPEHELRFERLSKLSDEVFDNVTYFNLVAISSAVVSLLLLLMGSDNLNANLYKIRGVFEAITGVSGEVLSYAKYGSRLLGLTFLMFLLSESVYTFLRAVGRVRFYFGMLKTMNDGIQP